MDFSSQPSGGKLDNAQRGQIMDQVKTQIALANAQELLQVSLEVHAQVRNTPTALLHHCTAIAFAIDIQHVCCSEWLHHTSN